MKKLAVLFLFFYVFSNTEVHELTKLPSMFMHYQEHLEHDQSIGFAKFIHIHYNTDHSHQDRDSEQMPFQDHHSAFTVIAPIKDIQAHSIKIQMSIPRIIKIHPGNEDFTSSSFIQQIWQPPRTC